jgi:glycosyltransferase involved in cell wall biosynthesis
MKEQHISLIICAYNEENYIRECLDHALKNSNGKLYEIIVVNNKSTDRTKEIALQFTGVRVVDENEKGLTKARQRGFTEARGNILAYIDADTRMPSGWVEKITKAFIENPTYASVSGPYVYYDMSKRDNFFVKLYWYIFAYPFYLIFGYMIVGGNFAIKKEVLEKMGGFDTTIEFYGEDTNIARRAHKFGKVQFLPSLVMPTSGRRLIEQGVVKTALIYGANFFSEIFLKRPAHTVYTDHR